jgi:hypothetical protein
MGRVGELSNRGNLPGLVDLQMGKEVLEYVQICKA